MQFDNKPKRCDHTDPCANEGTIFRDCTRGPIYDPRFFCKDHITEADAVQQRLHNKGNLTYQRSVVTNLELQLVAAREKLAAMEKAFEEQL